MSDPHTDAPQAESHEGVIRTPKQLIVTVVASFVLPVIVIILLVNFVTMGGKSGAGSDSMSEEAIARRIQRVGSIELRDLSSRGAVRTGEQVYNAVCTACHGIGAAGAPKTGDEAAWAPRIKTGYDAMLKSALEGKNAMPRQGGGEYSDYEVARAVVYLANKGGGKFAEPKAPASAASAAAASGAAAASAPK